MKKNTFTNEENKVLSEIYRRLNFFKDGNIHSTLLYLAYPSEAKRISKYNLLTPSSPEIKRTPNWYRLTHVGKAFFSNYITKEKLSEDMNEVLFDGSYVKKFDKYLLTEK